MPGKYQSDFAVQVTSQIPDAQQYTINFTNNNLLGSANFLDAYKTSKARVCVTVGMMTTGYDCPDMLNLALMRPVFSPSDFVQIKGRGTRKHDFLEQLFDKALKAQVGRAGQRRASSSSTSSPTANISKKSSTTTKCCKLPAAQALAKARRLGGRPRPPARTAIQPQRPRCHRRI